jgi:predicted Zn-dependent protease
MSKRLLFLEKTVKEGSQDPFAWYGLAMEYRKLERRDDALRVFADLRQREPGYVPMYLMCGQMLEEMGRRDEARQWLAAGIDAARAAGQTHALGELEGALAAL